MLSRRPPRRFAAGPRRGLSSVVGAALAAAVLSAWAGAAAAQVAQPEIRFTWTRGAGAESCPDGDMIADAVAARLGYFPFQSGAARALDAEVRAEEGRLLGSLRLYDENGALVGERLLESEGADCFELARALELAIAIAIDPAAFTRPPPAPLPEEEGPPAPPAESPPPVPSGEPEGAPEEGGATTGRVDMRPATVIEVPNTDRDRGTLAPPPVEGPAEAGEAPPEGPAGPPIVRDLSWWEGPTWQLSAWSGLTWASGTAPAPTFGLVPGGIGVRYKMASAMLEVRHDSPQSAATADGKSAALSSLTTTTAFLCAHSGWMYGCASGALGLLTVGAIGVGNPRLSTLPYAAVGGRAGADLPVLSWLGPFFSLWRLRLHVDVAAPLPWWRWRLRYDQPPNTLLWELPPVAVILGAAVVFAFPP